MRLPCCSELHMLTFEHVTMEGGRRGSVTPGRLQEALPAGPQMRTRLWLKVAEM